MQNTGSLNVTTPSDREIRITRTFDAPRAMVFEAYTRPELLKRWLTGPPGWSFSVCEVDLTVGGTYRYVWRGPDGVEMGMGGVYREIAVPERIVATEKFDQSWYPGEAMCTILFDEQNGRTMLTQTLLYESQEARDIALSSGMDQGMEAGFNNLDALLTSLNRETMEQPASAS